MEVAVHTIIALSQLHSCFTVLSHNSCEKLSCGIAMGTCFLLKACLQFCSSDTEKSESLAWSQARDVPVHT